MPKYDISGTFLGKPFTVRDVDSETIHHARLKVKNLVRFGDEPKMGNEGTFVKQKAKTSDTFINDFFKGFVK